MSPAIVSPPPTDLGFNRFDLRGSTVVLASQQEIDSLAARIRTAYTRRGSRWNESRSTSRVWSAAAAVLWQCRFEDPDVPIDPELFVAAQALDVDAPDPWTELASPQAAAAYRSRVRWIIRQLRAELDRELQFADEQARRGKPLSEIVCKPNSRLSPLCRYIVARRAARRDLADRWNREALSQHQSCPLYRDACLGLLAADEYPTASERPRSTLLPPIRAAAPPLTSLN